MSKDRTARRKAYLEAYAQLPPDQQRLHSAILLQSVVNGLLALAAQRAQAPALDVDVIDGECSVGGEA